MRRHSLVWAILVLLAVGLTAASPALARVYIDINAPYARQFPVAAPELKRLGGQGGAEEARQLIGLVAADLDFSGLFRILDPKGYLEDQAKSGLTAAETNFQAWTMIGAEFLVKGGFTSDGPTFSCELRFFDVRLGQLLVGKRYSGLVADWRLMAHKFADEIMHQVTGEAGVFQTRLAFVGNDTGHKEIYVSDFDGHGLRQLTNFRSISLDPTWAPDGRSLAFTSYKDGQPFLYRLDLATGGVQRLSSYKGLNITPAFSPDGDKIVVALSKDGDPELYMLSRSGQIIRRLTETPGIDVSATFSPDGSKIAFVSNRHGGPQIFIMDLAGGNIRRLTYEGNYNTSPCWSPRGDRIAYVSMVNGLFNIHTITPEGGKPQQLTLDQADNENPSWSADGRMIVFSSNREGSNALYVMTANGGHVKRITRSKGKQTSPSWSGRLWD